MITGIAAVPPADSSAPISPSLVERTYLVEEWKRAQSEYEKARIEQRIWETTTLEERQGAKRLKREFVAPLLSEQTSLIEQRSALLAAGSAAQPLWDRIAAKTMTTRQGWRVLRDARFIERSKALPLAHAVLEALKIFDTAPLYRGMKTQLKRPPLRGPNAAKRSTRLKNTPLAQSSRFWESIRTQVGEFMRERIEETEADPVVVERLMTDFIKDVKVLTDTWVSKIARAAGAERGSTVARRAVVIAACRTLLLDPPKLGKPVDLAIANSRKKSLARAYHPDGGGSAATTAQYQEVLEAYATLESYNESVRRR